MNRAQILSYVEAEHRAAFERLNVEWLERYFVVEPIDRALFAEPQRLIVDAGGAIFMASLDTEVVGTAALLPIGPQQFELGKMAVSELAQARGIGEMLARACIERARSSGAKQLELMTNSKLERAGRLYRRLGFRVIATGQHPKYKRTDLVMALDL
jgi:putative acetyltransferase